MRLGLLLLVALAACGGGGLRLSVPEARVGEVITTDEVGTQRLRFSVGGSAPTEMKTTTRSREHREILEASGTLALRVKLTVELDEDLRTSEGGSQSQTGPLAGKSYVVWSESGDLVATREDGSTPGAEEMRELESELADEVGQVPGEMKLLASRTWPTGKRVELNAAEMALLTQDFTQGEATGRKGAVTLQGTRGGIATFLVEIEADLVSDDSSMDVVGRITVEIDVARNRAVRSVTTGTMKGTAEGTPFEGTFEETTTHSYR